MMDEESWFKMPGGDSVSVESLRFYISGICFYKNGQLVYDTKGGYYLVDAAEEKSMALTVNIPGHISYDAIAFNLGIDSLTNVSGVQGGALDPANGMYWAWQSGYINFKLEGKSNLCATRKNMFQFHLGGYMLQDYAMQHILLNTNAGEVHIGIAVDKFLSSLDLRKQNSIMIPCPEAVMLSKQVAGCFELIR